MAVSIKHNFVSPVADGGESDIVGPSEWNDEHQVTGLATVAETGSYNDLSDKPSLATVATTGAYSDLTGTPSLATVATTGAYSDLSGTPTLGTAAALDAGTADGNVVQVQTGGKLPPLDGSDLTGIAGGDMSKSTYDPTNKAGDAFSQDNMADGTTNKNYTATEQTKLSGIEASADVTDATNVAAAGAFMKSADDSDDVTEGASHLFMTTSERSKLSGIEASADVTDAGNVGSTIHGATGKTTPVDADELALIDSAASNVLKKLTWANLKATLNAVYQPLASALTSWASVVRASGFDTFVATPSSANLRSLITDETGSGAAVFATAPTLSDPVVGTQSARDNSTKAASTAYVDGATREKLSADRTYFVDVTNGNDSNTGLSAGSGNAFATIQKAYNTIVTLDLNGFTATIKLADGTYSSGLVANTSPVGGNVIMDGNSGTPTNVILGLAIPIQLNCAINLTIQNMKINGTNRGVDLEHPGAYLLFGAGLNFGGSASGGQIFASAGKIEAGANNFTISASCARWLYMTANSVFDAYSSTITFSGTPAWSSAGIRFDSGAVVTFSGVTMSGSATGVRYQGVTNAVCQTFGAGSASTYFPGNSNGTVATGAQQA